MEERELIDQIYTKISKLGEGSYGTVYLYEQNQQKVKNPFNDLFINNTPKQSSYFAMKKYKNNDSRSGIDFTCLRELNALQTLRHINIAHSYDVIYKKSKNELYLVMDFHLELTHILTHLGDSLEAKKQICFQILRGVAFMHANFVFHRDLKPHNIFVSRSGYIKIADFGFAKSFGTPNRKYTTNVCTIEYRAPEIMFQTHYYNQKSDIWSLGCIISYIFTRKTLFYCQNPNQIKILQSIFRLRGTPNQKTWKNCSKFPKFRRFQQTQTPNLKEKLNLPEEVCSIIDKCLQLNPQQRPSAQQLLDSQFFKGLQVQPFDIEKQYNQKISKVMANLVND